MGVIQDIYTYDCLIDNLKENRLDIRENLRNQKTHTDMNLMLSKGPKVLSKWSAWNSDDSET